MRGEKSIKDAVNCGGMAEEKYKVVEDWRNDTEGDKPKSFIH